VGGRRYAGADCPTYWQALGRSRQPGHLGGSLLQGRADTSGAGGLRGMPGRWRRFVAVCVSRFRIGKRLSRFRLKLWSRFRLKLGRALCLKLPRIFI